MSDLDNPFNPNSKDTDGSDPLLEDVILAAVHGALLDVHTAMPAQVVAVKGTQRIDVQPLLKRQYTTGEEVLLPVIPDVPVQMICGADYFIKVPVAVGDVGMLIFQERSIELWSVKGGQVNPSDPRKFDLSDAVFVPGLNPFSAQISDSTQDLVIHNGSAELRLEKGGAFKVQKVGGDETFDLLVQVVNQLETLANTLSSDTVNTMLGPMQLNAYATYGTIKTAVDNLKTKLTALKG